MKLGTGSFVSGLLLLTLTAAQAATPAVPARLPNAPIATLEAVQDDFARVWARAQTEWSQRAAGLRITENRAPFQTLELQHTEEPGTAMRVGVECDANTLRVRVRGPRDAEWSGAAYLGLHRLGFLFPHPRRQISPAPSALAQHCGQVWTWSPRLEVRGMHLHSQHMNEWTTGFLQGRTDEERAIADDTIRWHARNLQNVLNVVVLRMPFTPMKASLTRAFGLAHRLGVATGVSASFAQRQQRAYRLIDNYVISNEPKRYEQFHLDQIRDGIRRLTEIPFQFVQLTMGTSEFTATDYDETLRWLEYARTEFERFNRIVFASVHVSINQTHPTYGNFNFLPQYSDSRLGVWPHTVMFYGLNDAFTPVYERTTFADMRDFQAQQARVRPTWYFPETGYFCGFDIDVPLLLTDYLAARTADTDYLETVGVRGQINFTTGQELGYWLFDWTLALSVLPEFRGDPLRGLELLGEDRATWDAILKFQTRFIKEGQLIQYLSSTTLLDEAPVVGKLVHTRVLLRDLAQRPSLIMQQISELEAAVAALPSLERVTDPELKLLLEVTHLRIRHALQLRRALRFRPDSRGRRFESALARDIRMQALARMRQLVRAYDRYPVARTFVKQPGRDSNPTSYRFGYGYTSAALHYWEREEKMVERNNFDPFFMNLFDPRDFVR